MNPRAAAFVDLVSSHINDLGQLKAEGTIPTEDYADALTQVMEAASVALENG